MASKLCALISPELARKIAESLVKNDRRFHSETWQKAINKSVESIKR